jgi:DNA-directed RNA polymerase subunit K/omega
MTETFSEYPDTMNSEISYEDDQVSDVEEETDTALEDETDTVAEDETDTVQEEGEDTYNEDDGDNEDDRADNDDDYDDDVSEKSDSNENDSTDPDCEYQYHEERKIEKEIIIPKEKRKCPNFLTKYEIARIIAIRSNQFEFGSQPAIETKNIPRIIPSIDLAMIELYYQKTPFIIRRPIGTNIYEEWKVSELKCTDLDFFKDVLKKYSII